MVRERFPFFPATRTIPSVTSTVTPSGSATGTFPILDIAYPPASNPRGAYQTWQSSSPPIASFFAFSPVMTPFDVERMETPNPLFTVGMASLAT